jgi:hypothetical protein
MGSQSEFVLTKPQNKQSQSLLLAKASWNVLVGPVPRLFPGLRRLSVGFVISQFNVGK